MINKNKFGATMLFAFAVLFLTIMVVSLDPSPVVMLLFILAIGILILSFAALTWSSANHEKK